MTFSTGNAIGSTDTRDLSDNAENFDKAINSIESTWNDRLGVARDTFEGALSRLSFYRVGTFAAGYTLTNMRQTLEYGGNEYGWNGTFPKVVAAGATPATSGGIGAGAWVFRSDASLRSDLLSQGGAALIGTSNSETVEQRLSNQAGLISRKADLAGSSSQQFSIADATNDTSATSLGQVKSRTKKGGLTQSISSNALTLTQAKRLFNFRSATLTDGTAVEVTPTSVLTLTVPSGATLGATSGVPADFLELLLYNDGSPVIGVVNANGGLNLDESGLISSTAISASATSASVVYSSVAVANSPYIILNRLSVTLPTAGSWSVLPTVKPVELQSTAIKSNIILLPAIATTSGLSIGFQIPSWAKKITVQMVGVSTSATSVVLIKLGVGGVAQSSTYSSSGFFYSNIFSTSTTGFFVGYRQNAGGIIDGAITLTKHSDLSWTAQGYTHNANPGNSGSAGGSCTLTGVADSLFLTTTNGTDTFDAGSVSLLIEG